MKNTNQIFVVILAVAILVVGGVMYFVGRNQNSGTQASTGTATSVSDMKQLTNQLAPDFTLNDKNGVAHKLSDLKGKTVVLFFNEGLMCYPACWNQMAQLSSDSRLNTASVVSYSVVVDTPNNWGPAIKQMPALAQANVLYDTNGSVSRAYAMLTAGSSMHYGMYPGHSYVVIDSQGTVRYVLDDPRMAINNDLIAQEISELNQSAFSAASSTTAR